MSEDTKTEAQEETSAAPIKEPKNEMEASTATAERPSESGGADKEEPREPRLRRRGRTKVSYLTINKIHYVDYKEIGMLKRFLNDRGKILPRRQSGNTAKQQRMITIEGRGMLGVPGMAARAFGAVAATQTSVTLISQASSEQSICFTVPSESADLVISEIEKAFKLELQDRDIDRIWATDDTVIVTVVGAGIRDMPGVAGALFSALAEHEVNIIAIAQGSSDSALSMVVDAEDANTVIRALHQLIVDNWEESHK